MCPLFRRAANYRLFDKGLKELHQEINIVEVLRDTRLTNQVVKKMMKSFTPQERKNMYDAQDRMVTLANSSTLMSGSLTIDDGESQRITTESENSEDDGNPAQIQAPSRATKGILKKQKTIANKISDVTSEFSHQNDLPPKSEYIEL